MPIIINCGLLKLLQEYFNHFISTLYVNFLFRSSNLCIRCAFLPIWSISFWGSWWSWSTEQRKTRYTHQCRASMSFFNCFWNYYFLAVLTGMHSKFKHNFILGYRNHYEGQEKTSNQRQSVQCHLYSVWAIIIFYFFQSTRVCPGNKTVPFNSPLVKFPHVCSKCFPTIQTQCKSFPFPDYTITFSGNTELSKTLPICIFFLELPMASLKKVYTCHLCMLMR